MARVGRAPAVEMIEPQGSGHLPGPASRKAVCRQYAAGSVALWAGLLAATGCTPTLATMEPARTVPEGHWQLSASTGASLPVGDPLSAIDEIGKIEKGAELDPEEIRTVARGSAVIFVHPPGVNANVAAAYGLSKRIEVGMRGSPDMVRGWLRCQFLRARPGFYGAAGLGLAAYFAGFPVEDYTERAEPVSYSRHEMDLPVHLGVSGRVGHVWFGPKFIFADYDVEESVCGVMSEGQCQSWGRTRVTGTVSYLGAQLGGAVGYRRVWVAAELSFMSLKVDAELDIDVHETQEVVDYRTDGWAISPALGLIMWF